MRKKEGEARRRGGGDEGRRERAEGGGEGEEEGGRGGRGLCERLWEREVWVGVLSPYPPAMRCQLIRPLLIPANRRLTPPLYCAAPVGATPSFTAESKAFTPTPGPKRDDVLC
eukprot:97423-Rhodomonas_salina.2